MLSEADEQELLAALHHIGAADGLVDFGRRTCQELLRLVPGVSASYNEINVVASRAAVVVHPEPSREELEHYGPVYERHMLENPVAAHWEANGEDSIVSWTDVDPTGTFTATTLYREFYVPLGVLSQLAFLLPAPPGIHVALAINRDGTEFSARERELVAALRPHLVKLYRLVGHAEASHARDAALADDGWSVVLVDDDGTVRDSNHLAVAIGEAAGIDLRVGATLAGRALWRSVLSSGLNLWASSRSPEQGVPAQRVPFEARLVRSGVGPHLLLLRQAPTSLTVSDVVALGLTKRQAEVALLLVDGLTNDQIARRLGIARGTVRKHLEGAFKRLEVPSRAAAVGKLQARARRWSG